MTKDRKQFFTYIILTLVILLFIKVDYRFKEIFPGGSQDDSVYFYHTQTLAIDFDLDYTNQLDGNLRDAFIRNDNKPVPRQSLGPGIFSSPFLLVSNFISRLFSINSNTSFNYFIYSFISTFYLCLSLVLIKKIINVKNINDSGKIILFTLGSGISYYAFERFSMSAVYEFFSICLIFFVVNKIYNLKNLKYQNSIIFLLGVVQFLMLLNRWNNLHLFLIPLIYIYLNNKNIKTIYKNVTYYIGLVVGTGLFLLHTYLLYGIFTFFQRDIYPSTGWAVTERLSRFYDLSILTENILLVWKYFINTCFSMEFGIFYFSSIVFSSLIFLFYFLYKKKYSLFLILFIFYAIPFLPVLVFENHGTSYGFRYLFTIIPVNIIIYFKEFSKNKLLTIYLMTFSIFGLFSQLFFESTNLVSLSETTIVNSFDSMSPYSNPDYLTGLLKSLLMPNAYLKIIFTSFLGVFLIKFINLFTSFEDFVSNYYVIDEQLFELISSVNRFSWIYFILTLIFILFGIKNLLFRTY